MSFNKVLSTLLIGAFGVNFFIMQKMFSLIALGLVLIFSLVIIYVDNMNLNTLEDFQSRFESVNNKLNSLSDDYINLHKKVKKHEKQQLKGFSDDEY